MNRTARSLLAASLALIPTAAAHALIGGDNFTITDGNMDFTVSNISSARTTSAAGMANLRTEIGSALERDQIFQNWFWYRTASDSREYALSNRVSGGGDTGPDERLVFVEPAGDGSINNALMIILEYTITDLTRTEASLDEPPVARITIAFSVRNLLSQNLNVQLFNYNDYDLSGTSADDTVYVDGADNHIQQYADTGPVVTRALANYSVSGGNLINFELANFPALVNRLADGSPDTLADAPFSLPAGDVTGANQWGTTLGPAGAATDTLVGSVTLEVTLNPFRCRADFDGNGVVNAADAGAFLTEYFASLGACP